MYSAIGWSLLLHASVLVLIQIAASKTPCRSILLSSKENHASSTTRHQALDNNNWFTNEYWRCENADVEYTAQYQLAVSDADEKLNWVIFDGNYSTRTAGTAAPRTKAYSRLTLEQKMIHKQIYANGLCEENFGDGAKAESSSIGHGLLPQTISGSSLDIDFPLHAKCQTTFRHMFPFICESKSACAIPTEAECRNARIYKRKRLNLMYTCDAIFQSIDSRNEFLEWRREDKPTQFGLNALCIFDAFYVCVPSADRDAIAWRPLPVLTFHNLPLYAITTVFGTADIALNVEYGYYPTTTQRRRRMFDIATETETETETESETQFEFDGHADMNTLESILQQTLERGKNKLLSEQNGVAASASSSNARRILLPSVYEPKCGIGISVNGELYDFTVHGNRTMFTMFVVDLYASNNHAVSGILYDISYVHGVVHKRIKERIATDVSIVDRAFTFIFRWFHNSLDAKHGKYAHLSTLNLTDTYDGTDKPNAFQIAIETADAITELLHFTHSMSAEYFGLHIDTVDLTFFCVDALSVLRGTPLTHAAAADIRLLFTTSPTPAPTPTSEPTTHPVAPTAPTAPPSSDPSRAPTAQPSRSPSAQPSAHPSPDPTRVPSSTPSTDPTRSPSASPSTHPSESPTSAPSASPSGSPSLSPSQNPSTSPTANPSGSPTRAPSLSPSASPTTANPTSTPTESPTTALPMHFALAVPGGYAGPVSVRATLNDTSSASTSASAPADPDTHCTVLVNSTFHPGFEIAIELGNNNGVAVKANIYEKDGDVVPASIEWKGIHSGESFDLNFFYYRDTFMAAEMVEITLQTAYMYNGENIFLMDMKLDTFGLVHNTSAVLFNIYTECLANTSASALTHWALDVFDNSGSNHSNDTVQQLFASWTSTSKEIYPGYHIPLKVLKLDLNDSLLVVNNYTLVFTVIPTDFDAFTPAATIYFVESNATDFQFVNFNAIPLVGVEISKNDSNFFEFYFENIDIHPLTHPYQIPVTHIIQFWFHIQLLPYTKIDLILFDTAHDHTDVINIYNDVNHTLICLQIARADIVKGKGFDFNFIAETNKGLILLHS